MGAEKNTILPGREEHFCPYCDEEVAEVSWPYCGACEVTVFYCPSCRATIPRDKNICPHCGAKIRGEKSQEGK